MTNEINQNWKAIASISIAAVLIVAILSFNPLPTNVAEAAGAPKQTGCAPENVRHWDKIIFELTQSFETDTLGENPPLLLDGLAYDIKVPDTVGVIADLHGIVAADLVSKGYDSVSSTMAPEPNDIIIRDVEYAIFCIAP